MKSIKFLLLSTLCIAQKIDSVVIANGNATTANTTFTTTTSAASKDQRSVIIISILAFVLLVIALYFVNYKEFKAPLKKKSSSRKRS